MYIQLSANQMNTRVSLIDLQTDTGVHLVCTQLYVRHHSLKTSKNQRFCSECFFLELLAIVVPVRKALASVVQLGIHEAIVN